MGRISEFFKDIGMTAAVFESKISPAGKWIARLLLIAGFSVPALIGWFEPTATFRVPRWSCWCIPLLIVVTWIASRSWLRTSGPLIEMGGLRLIDPAQQIYAITITNAGRISVMPEVRLLSICDLDGRPTRQFHHSMTVRKTNRKELTSYREYTDVPILRIIVNPVNIDEWALAAFVMADAEPLRITPFMRHGELTPFRVKISAFCGDGKIGNAVQKTFVLTSRREWPGYDVNPERKRWL